MCLCLSGSRVSRPVVVKAVVEVLVVRAVVLAVSTPRRKTTCTARRGVEARGACSLDVLLELRAVRAPKCRWLVLDACWYFLADL